jgi:pimeloyl-ACP methyl ester carboxylesterase
MIDNRESGESDPEDGPYSVADMAADGASLLDALSIDRAYVLGHSMGGFIALNLTVDHPHLVERLILVSTTAATGAALGRPEPKLDRDNWIADPVERTRRQLQSAAGPGYFDAHPEQLEAVSELMRNNRLSFDGMVRRIHATYSSHDVRARLGSIAAPTLIIHGDADRSIPLESGRALADGIPNARLIVFEGVGHFPQLERTDDFHRAVIDFLQSSPA